MEFLPLAAAGFVAATLLCLPMNANLEKYIMRQIICPCIHVQKTSSFKQLKYSSIINITAPFPRDEKSLEALLALISENPSVAFGGPAKDLKLILRALYEQKRELFVDSMDYIAVFHNGCKLLKFELEKQPDYVSFDRSVYIDVVECRSKSFEMYCRLVTAMSVATLVIFSCDEVKRVIAKMF